MIVIQALLKKIQLGATAGAFDEVDGIEVAWNQVKIQDVLQSPDDLERLYSEVHLLKTLKHKNIIKFYNSWVDIKLKNVNFITEIFTSGTLRQYRKRHKHVDIKAVKNWARQILRGLLYLHSHDPPIIHRDLKCDNIFVNGNQGEVKIGDLGLAAILRQAHAAHSVIGTPEFMAPELYEEEYNELVDIYSFGMCLLEMVTFEYPYSECTNAAQIYKKVTSGKKPAALDKVKDPDVRAFVDKCLATASRRLPARELLMDPFLQCEGDRETLDCISLISGSNFKVDDMNELGTLTDNSTSPTPSLRFADKVQLGADNLNLENGKNQRTSSDPSAIDRAGGSTANQNLNNGGGENYDKGLSSSNWIQGSRDFRVKGKRRDDDTIFLRLRIADLEGHVRNIHFPFDVEGDTAMSVASEMVAELDLSDQDVTTIAEMIDAEILSLVPEWKPGVACEDISAIEGDGCVDDEYDFEANDNKYIPSHHKFDPLTTVSSEGSLLDRLPSTSIPTPKLNLMTSNSSAKTEGTMHGRFEEVMYPVCVPYCAEGPEEPPPFSTDSSDLPEDGEWDLIGDQSPPLTPQSDQSCGISNAFFDQPIQRSSKTTVMEIGAGLGQSMDFNELVESQRNASHCKYTHETWEGIARDKFLHM